MSEPRADPARAVLWDLDGTLVDTEPSWIDAEYALAEKYGGSWSQEHALALVGSDLLDSGAYIREHMGIDLAPAAVVEELLDGVVAAIERHVPWRDGARELLASVRETGVPCALVTMSYARFADPIVRALPPGTFDVVVTGDVVRRGKPHPDPYLLAAEQLGLDPAACVAVEDSPPGAASAEAAGCRLLVVPNHVEVPDAPGRVFATSLADVRLDDLLHLGTAPAR